jgi:hypothetical protein
MFVAQTSLQTDVERRAVPNPLGHPAPQYVGVVLATALMSAMHWQNDGLWFQGDAPRHAVTGLFFWDLLTSLTTAPLQYALSYYARYPVIAPVAYPPLFYVPEGFAYWLFGPSAHVAKAMVLLFAVITGFYTTAWARRWIAPVAGWAGVCLVLLPGFVLFSNAVLLNVPATALGVGALYHLRRWLDGERSTHLKLFGGLAVAATLTYYPAAIVLPIALTLMLWSRHGVRTWLFWALVGGIVLLVVLTAMVVPNYLARHTGSLDLLFELRRWRIFSRTLTILAGANWLVLAGAGLLLGALSSKTRREAATLFLAFASVFVCLLVLRSVDARYLLILGPIIVLSGFAGLVALSEWVGQWRVALVSVGVVALVTVAGTAAAGTTVPNVAGFDRVAEYLRDHATHDSVLYRGRYDGVFGFYLRALDPRFERRMVLWRKLLSDETRVSIAPSEVVHVVKTRSGCRWFALEISDSEPPTGVEAILRHALAGPEFELVQSFPVQAAGISRVDLYRFKLDLDPAPSIDLSFGGFSSRVFRGVEPIPTRQ